MSTTFFIGDTHFGHKNILKYEQIARPFDSLEEMTEVMVNKWNNVVRAGDRVIHVGDFSFGSIGLEVAARLNGLKILVGGNHDCLATESYLKHFHKVLGCMDFDNNIITHIPIHPSQFFRYKANIHGHLHSSNINDLRYINVSCEQLGLAPMAYEDIINNRGKVTYV